MEQLRQIIANNIVELRRKSGLTQIELAEKINYSDKAVSKWERGDSLPDVAVLKQLADLFGVSVDYLLTDDHSTPVALQSDIQRRKVNHLIISLLSMMIVWTVATVIFVILGMIPWSNIDEPLTRIWVVFVYALPVSAIVLIVFNTIWGNRRRNYIFVSILVWSIVVALFLTLWLVNVNSAHLWLVLLLGVPAQIIIILWSRLRIKHTKQ